MSEDNQSTGGEATPTPPPPESSPTPGCSGSGCASVLGIVCVIAGLVIMNGERGQEFCGQQGYEASCSFAELLDGLGQFLLVAGVIVIVAGVLSARRKAR